MGVQGRYHIGVEIAPLFTTYKINPVMMDDEMTKVGFEDSEVVSAMLWKEPTLVSKIPHLPSSKSVNDQENSKVLSDTYNLMKKSVFRMQFQY